ncbi:F-box/WD repeat-containing protein 7-like [Homalodisca vitripennis]|uniref:F-box/WD repeat-containing protein 7-like n=1 Tax=Homalodisca vitripennis TaxID=197043 RepID=UPI001EECC3D6|nr:F-box/WD repeat-containing protein 7-like [Homalodisca vitripennis]
MDTLPPEMVEKISFYLTAQDLVSCYSVSRVWRTIFNQDSLWKPHCHQNFEEYLRTTPCITKPPFMIPETESSGLSPACQWRLAYMREGRLWKNWRTGNCKLYKIMSSADRYNTTGIDYIIQEFEDNAAFFKNDDSGANIQVESTTDSRESGFF